MLIVTCVRYSTGSATIVNPVFMVFGIGLGCASLGSVRWTILHSSWAFRQDVA